MKLKIKVTKEVIKKAIYCGFGDNKTISTNCAVALAVRDIFPNAQVSNKITTWTCKNDIIFIPKSAKDFIEEFDNSTPQERLLIPAFEFEVFISDEIINSINVDDIHKSETLEVIA